MTPSHRIGTKTAAQEIRVAIEVDVAMTVLVAFARHAVGDVMMRWPSHGTRIAGSGVRTDLMFMGTVDAVMPVLAASVRHEVGGVTTRSHSHGTRIARNGVMTHIMVMEMVDTVDMVEIVMEGMAGHQSMLAISVKITSHM